jgi:hypothetical protein
MKDWCPAFVMEMKKIPGGFEWKKRKLRATQQSEVTFYRHVKRLVRAYAQSIIDALNVYFPPDQMTVAAAFNVFTPIGIPDIDSAEAFSEKQADKRMELLLENYSASHLITESLSEGDRVSIYWDEMAKSYPATIITCNSDGTYKVRYDDEEQEARNNKLTVEEFRANKSLCPPALFDRVERSDIATIEGGASTAQVPGIIDRVAAKAEWATVKPLFVREKLAAGRRITARDFANHLLNTLPEHLYPQMRRLILVMLLIPASSVQSERDFSGVDRVKVKGRASLGSGDKVDKLDQLLRLYLLPRSWFSLKMQELGADPAVVRLQRNPVPHICRTPEARAVCLEAWRSWSAARAATASTTAASTERRGTKRGHPDAGGEAARAD